LNTKDYQCPVAGSLKKHFKINLKDKLKTLEEGLFKATDSPQGGISFEHFICQELRRFSAHLDRVITEKSKLINKINLLLQQQKISNQG
jgi:hypothetical protein